MSSRVPRPGQPATVEDADEETDATLPGTKKVANVTVKRTQSDPLAGPDGSSDSGYSSRTAATATTATSGSDKLVVGGATRKNNPVELQVNTSGIKHRGGDRPALEKRRTDSAVPKQSRLNKLFGSRSSPSKSESKTKNKASARQAPPPAEPPKRSASACVCKQCQDQRSRGRQSNLEHHHHHHHHHSQPPLVISTPVDSRYQTPQYAQPRQIPIPTTQAQPPHWPAIPPSPQSPRDPSHMYFPDPQLQYARPQLRPARSNSVQSASSMRPSSYYGGIPQHEGSYYPSASVHQPVYDMHGQPPPSVMYSSTPPPQSPYVRGPPTPVYPTSYAGNPMTPLASQYIPRDEPRSDPAYTARPVRPHDSRRSSSQYGPPVIEHSAPQTPAAEPSYRERRQSVQLERDEDFYLMPPPPKPAQVIPVERERPSMARRFSMGQKQRSHSIEPGATRPRLVERSSSRKHSSEAIEQRRRPSMTVHGNRHSVSYPSTDEPRRRRDSLYGHPQDFELKAERVEDYQAAQGSGTPLTVNALNKVNRTTSRSISDGSHHTESSRGSDQKHRTSVGKSSDLDNLTLSINGLRIGMSSRDVENKKINLRSTDRNGGVELTVHGSARREKKYDTPSEYSNGSVRRNLREIEGPVARVRDMSTASRRSSKSGYSGRGLID